MPRFAPIQTAFNAGELSGRVRGRTDTPIYKAGLAYCENFEPTPQGSLRMRAGTEKVTTLGTASPLIRLAAFPVAGHQDYVLELGSTVRAYDAYGIVTGSGGGGAVELVSNGGFDAGIAGWTAVPDMVGISFASGRLRLNGNASDGHWGVRQSLAVVGAGVHPVRVSVYPGGSAPFYLSNYVRVRVGTAPGGNDLLDVQVLANTTYIGSFTAAGAGTVYLELTHGGTNLVLVDDVSVTTPVAGGGVVEFASPWTLDQLADVQWAAETAKDRTIFVHGNVAPYILARSALNAWTFLPITDASFSSVLPAEWAGANWPSVVEIHDGRLYLGGTPNERNRFWAAKAGTMFNFTAPGANPGDTLDYKIATKGALRWMHSSRKLFAATDLGEHSISGSQGTPLNGDVQVRPESAFGVATQRPVSAGIHTLFVTGDRQKVRAMTYTQEGDAWRSEDITFFAEHLMRACIKEIHHLFAPEGVLTALLDSGEVRACSFAPDQNVVAWWRVGPASGTVRSMAVSRGASQSHLWLAVERGGVNHLERLPLSEVEPVRYLDASVTALADANGNVTGLTHLTGQVRVLADGALAGDYTVNAGTVALGLEYANASVIVGYAYRAKAVTLPLEGGDPAGTSQGAKVKYPDFTVRVNESAAPFLNGTRAGPGRPFSTPMDEAEELVTDDLVAKNDKVGATVIIEQDLPFRTEVCALFSGSVTVGRI